MARNDIRCAVLAPDGMWYYHIDSGIVGATTFEEGEPVTIQDASGALQESGDDNSVITGISAGNSQERTTNGIGISTKPDGSVIQVYKAIRGNVFACGHFGTAGTGATTTPTLANAMGETAGITNDGTNYVVDTGAANHLVEITGVYYAQNRQRIGDETQPAPADPTQRFVTFEFI